MTKQINAHNHARFNGLAKHGNQIAKRGVGGHQQFQSKRFQHCCCVGHQKPVNNPYVNNGGYLNNGGYVGNHYNQTINVNLQVAQIISSLHNLISNFLAQQGFQGSLPLNPGGGSLFPGGLGGYQPGPIGHGGGYLPGPGGHGGFPGGWQPGHGGHGGIPGGWQPGPGIPTPPAPPAPPHPGNPKPPTGGGGNPKPPVPGGPKPPAGSWVHIAPGLVPKPENLKAGQVFSRLVPADQAAKEGELSGKDRPNAREISNAVAAQGDKETQNANGASDLLWSWGQFIDHDLTLSREGHEKADIKVKRGDKHLDPTHSGKSFIPFKKSDTVVDANGVHQQINDQTPLMDASMIYGTKKSQTDGMRTFEGGKMKLVDGHLPPDEKNKVLSGDPRAAEQPGLLSLQTLFVREHNRLADILSKRNPKLTDQQVFSEARRLVTGQIQAITYNEFLPTLVGKDRADPGNYNYGKGPVDGRISNEFATAAYRVGHTMVSDTIAIKNKDGTTRQVGLDEVFFKPEFTQKEGLAAVLGGQAGQTAEKVDNQLVDSLRNRLFGPPTGGPGMDLAALNIQRGRDHNLPSYNDMRESMGLHRITSFDDPIFQDGVGKKLASVYKNPDEIDLWVGGLGEKPVGNSMLGSTFTGIVGDQFARTAQADPNFYTRSASQVEQQWLNSLSLGDIIRFNTDNAQVDDTVFIATD